MEIRATLLPHDLQHCLDNASQCCGITAAAEIAIRLYGQADRLDAIWNAETDAKRRFSTLLDREIAVERYGAEIITQLPGPRRTAIVERGLLSLTHDVIAKAEWLSDSHYEDMTKGGCFRSFLKQHRLGKDMLPTPKLARRLRGRGAIKRYIFAEFDEMRKQRTIFEILASIPAGGPATNEDRDAIFRDLDGQMESHARVARQAIENAVWTSRFVDGRLDEQIDQVIVRLKPGIRYKLREERNQRRRVIKRAAVLAAAVLGASTVSAFARGEQVLLAGPDVSISARLTGQISGNGHGALAIGVHQPDGTKLAGVCVYQEAPALDQLVSLAMHVRSGNVDDILSVGNLYAIEPAADAHPIIAAHRSAHQVPEQVLAAAGWSRVRWRDVPRDDRKTFEAGKAAYQQEMCGVYEEIIATAVFGRAAPIWRRLRASLAFEG